MPTYETKAKKPITSETIAAMMEARLELPKEFLEDFISTLMKELFFHAYNYSQIFLIESICRIGFYDVTLTPEGKRVQAKNLRQKEKPGKVTAASLPDIKRVGLLMFKEYYSDFWDGFHDSEDD